MELWKIYCTIAVFILPYVGSNLLHLQMISDVIVAFSYKPYVTSFSCNESSFPEATKFLSQRGIVAKFNNLDEMRSKSFTFESSGVFTLNMHCKNSHKFVTSINKRGFFDHRYKWIFIFNNFTTDSTRLFENVTNEIHTLVDSDVVFASQISETEILLQEVYKIHVAACNRINNIGIWHSKTGLSASNELTQLRRARKNLSKMIMNTCIVITNNDTLHHLKDKREKHIDTITKVNLILVEHLGDFVNATLNFSIEPTWGYKDNDSRWNGMIGELTRKVAVIGGTALFFTADRVSEIDYLSMTSPTKSKFVFRQPKLSYVSNVYTLPFHWSVWLSSVVMMLIITVTLYGTVNWERRTNTFKIKPYETVLEGKFSDVFFLSLGAVCQQGTVYIPRGVASRLITILMFLALMFLYTSYSANIVALLQSSSNNIRTLNDLLHSRLGIGVDDTVFNHYYFSNATEPVRRAIYKQKVAPPGQKQRFFPIETGVRMLRQGLFAFHMETGAGYKIIGDTFQEHEKCDLHEIEYLQVPDPWMAVQKNTSYKEMFKIGLRLIHESGLQEREVGLLYTKKPRCSFRGNSFVTVGLIDCYAAAAVYATGFASAMAIFAIELCLKKYHKRVYSSK